MTVSVSDIHNPSLHSFQINNDRTAWRPIGLPVILVEPDRRDPLGNPIELSNVSNVRIVIEDVPQRAPVAGHDNVGLFYPDRELFAVNISTVELYNRLIDPSGQRFFQPDGTEVSFEDATLGDFMQYTTSTGIRDTITYIPSSNYYDLSDFTIDTEELPPDYYIIRYQAEYFVRVTSGLENNELLCIDGTRQATAVFRFRINHPGQVIEEQVRLTPGVYFTNENKADDTTVGFYRPFTDALQDIFDESVLLEQINWVDKVTPEFVPYLAYLIGLDIPFFPRSLDNLRRVMLRNIVRLQQLKGSRRALIDLFSLFGFNIFLINLYWSEKACRLVRPGEELPAEFDDQEIQIIEQCQIEPLLAEYDTDGFGDLTIPLLYRPTTIQVVDGIATRIDGGEIVVDGFLVEENSAAHTQLQTIMNNVNADPSGYGESVGCDLPPVTGSGIVGYSQIILDSLTGEVTDETQMGIQPPFGNKGTTYNASQNYINLVFNGAILFNVPNTLRPSSPNLKLFTFATYDRQEFIVPEEMQDLQSNRFDVQILTRTDQQVEPEVLVFLVDFLFKFKAFHSLLNVLIYGFDLNETYEVTDWCVGGDVKQRYDTDAGMLQVPPAIIPNLPDDGDCNLTPEDLGYKDEDILLRNRKLENLEEEHEAWKALDARAGSSGGITSLQQPLDNIDRTECKFTNRGQDKILTGSKTEAKETGYNPGPNANSQSAASEPNLDESPVQEVQDGVFDPVANRNAEYSGYGSFSREYTEPQEPLCTEDGVTDFCYKGRVEDEVLYQQALTATELFRCHPCSLGMGSGVYYTFPVPSKLVASNPVKNIFSGLASQAGIAGYLESTQSNYLSVDYSLPLSTQNNSWLGRLLRAYDQPTGTSLHYTNRYTTGNGKQKHFLAIQRPELDIEMSIMHFPGCRFPTMNRLESDFTHPTYTARPWDDAYSTYCGPASQACATQPTFLNATLQVGTNGYEILVFDEVPFTVIGNGLVPDISSLGDQIVPTGIDWDEANDVVHRVYSSQYDGHAAITLDGMCPCSLTDEDPNAEGDLQADDLIQVFDPLFQSAGRCVDGDYLDYCDGYACERGYQDRGDADVDRAGLYEELFDALGIPRTSDPSTADSLFFLTSGIRVTTGIRLDCGCNIVDCSSATDITAPTMTEPVATLQIPCNADLFYDSEGERDWNCDQIEIETNMILQESFGTHCVPFDGSIPTMFEMLANCCQGTGSAKVIE